MTDQFENGPRGPKRLRGPKRMSARTNRAINCGMPIEPNITHLATALGELSHSPCAETRTAESATDALRILDRSLIPWIALFLAFEAATAG